MSKTNTPNEAAVDLRGIHRISAIDAVEHFGKAEGNDDETPAVEKVEVRLELNARTLAKAKEGAARSGVEFSHYVDRALDRFTEGKGVLTREGGGYLRDWERYLRQGELYIDEGERDPDEGETYFDGVDDRPDD